MNNSEILNSQEEHKIEILTEKAPVIEKQFTFEMGMFFQLCFVERNLVEQTVGLIGGEIIDAKFSTPYKGKSNYIRIMYDTKTDEVNLFLQINTKVDNFYKISQQETINIINEIKL